MGQYRLKYPVHDLDERELLPAGTDLTKEVLDELRAAGRSVRSENIRLLDHGSVREDILTFLSQPPYNIICTGPARTLSMLKLMHKVSLPRKLLKFMDYFKANDFYTYRHMLVVFALSVVLSREILHSNSYLLAESAAAPLHDFGNISIPLEILHKEEPLTPDEQDILQHHTLAGYVLLTYYMNDDGFLAARMARDHHERMDGSGYPMGTAFADIPVEIVTVCDIYDALLSPRAFRRVSYNNRGALDIICMKGENGEINPQIVRALVACNRKDNPHYSDCALSARREGM